MVDPTSEANTPDRKGKSPGRLISRLWVETWRSLTALFNLNRSGSWVRLIFIVVFSGLFFISISPFSAWASNLWQSIQENTLPGLANSLRALWGIFSGGTTVPVSTEPTNLILPQEGWITRFELMWTSQGFSSLMQSILIAFIPFIIAFLTAAYYFQYIHNIPRFFLAFGHLFRMILPMPRIRMRLQNGVLMQKGESLSIERVGGPSRINLDKTNAALFERSNGTNQVLLPGQMKVPIEGYECLRTVLDVREEGLVLTVSGRTRDGMKLQARKARFAYQLYPSEIEINASKEQQRAGYQAFVYQSWLGNDWEKPEKRRKAMKDYVATELRAFISQHNLADFFGTISAQGETATPGYRILDPFYIFAEGFSKSGWGANTGKGIVQLKWMGEGEWVFLTEISLRDHMQTWYLWLESKLRTSPNSQKSIHRQEWQEEMDKLVREAPLDAYHQLKGNKQEDFLLGLAIAYRDKLEADQKSNIISNPEDKENLELVLRHLKRITRH